MDCSLPGSSLHGMLCSPGQNTGVGSHSLLQGIFPTQESNPGLLIAGGFFTILATREAQKGHIEVQIAKTVLFTIGHPSQSCQLYW